MTPKTISIDGHRYKYRLNQERQGWALAFFPKYLVQVEGRWAGQPFALMDWESELMRAIYGPEIFDPELGMWVRLTTEGYLEIPKKSGKSGWGSGIGILELACPTNEPGIGIYSVASDTDQANIVYGLGRKQVEADPRLESRIRCYRRIMEHKKSGRTWRVIPADTDTNDGEKMAIAIMDELHRQRHRELMDLIRASQSTATEPLLLSLTTAGDEESRICREVHDYGEKVQAGSIVNPRFHYRRYGMDDGDDWEDKKVWRKANPALGTTKTMAFLRGEYARAKASPAEQSSFIRYQLNGWYQSDNRWLTAGLWEASQTAAGVEEGALARRDCFCGLDLSSTTDITALIGLVEDDAGTLKVVSRFWMPADTLAEACKRDRVPYDQWAREGYITPTEGNKVDYDVMRTDIGKFAERFRIIECAFDRWNASQLVTQLEGDGLVMVQHGQGTADMTAPTKELYGMLLDATAASPQVRLDHGGNPVLAWMASNVAVKQDAMGGIRPDKAKSRLRIDGIVALIMALGRWSRHQGEAETWVASW